LTMMLGYEPDAQNEPSDCWFSNRVSSVEVDTPQAGPQLLARRRRRASARW